MGKELCEAFPHVKERYFDRADQILGFGISRLCFEGPEEELLKTENQQPAIFLVGCATGAVLRESGLEPDAAAGHSLGEYSALTAAGSVAFEAALRLTRRRGELMADVAARTGGIMAAIIGLSPEEVENICRGASAQGITEVANYNSPTQTVISGEEAAVKRAMDLARERGAQRTSQLNVSAPFHCSLMQPLGAAFEPELQQVPVEDPLIPVVANVTADYEQTGNAIRANLIAQLASPVRWTASVQRLIDDGFDTFVEVGPGRVLTHLMRAFNSQALTFHTNDPSGIDSTLRKLAL